LTPIQEQAILNRYGSDCKFFKLNSQRLFDYLLENNPDSLSLNLSGESISFNFNSSKNLAEDILVTATLQSGEYHSNLGDVLFKKDGLFNNKHIINFTCSADRLHLFGEDQNKYYFISKIDSLDLEDHFAFYSKIKVQNNDFNSQTLMCDPNVINETAGSGKSIRLFFDLSYSFFEKQKDPNEPDILKQINAVKRKPLDILDWSEFIYYKTFNVVTDITRIHLNTIPEQSEEADLDATVQRWYTDQCFDNYDIVVRAIGTFIEGGNARSDAELRWRPASEGFGGILLGTVGFRSSVLAHEITHNLTGVDHPDDSCPEMCNNGLEFVRPDGSKIRERSLSCSSGSLMTTYDDFAEFGFIDTRSQSLMIPRLQHLNSQTLLPNFCEGMRCWTGLTGRPRQINIDLGCEANQTFELTITVSNNNCNQIASITDFKFFRSNGLSVIDFGELTYLGTSPGSIANTSADLLGNLQLLPMESKVFKLKVKVLGTNTIGSGFATWFELKINGGVKKIFDGTVMTLDNFTVPYTSNAVNFSQLRFNFPFSFPPNVTCFDKVNIKFVHNGAPFVMNVTNLCFGPNSTFKFEPGSELIINPGVNITFRGVNFVNCGPQMWKGINIQSGASVVFEDCTISGAVYAINAQPNSKIALSRNIFLNNNIGLYANFAAKENVVLNPFTDNTFKSEGFTSLLPYTNQTVSLNQKPYCGVFFNNLSYCIMRRNNFENLQNGVICSKGTISMAFNNFSNIFGSTNLLSSNSGSAISLTGPIPYLSIYKNNIVNIYCAIDIINASHFITYNNIKNVVKGIRLKNGFMINSNIGYNVIHSMNNCLTVENQILMNSSNIEYNNFKVNGSIVPAIGIIWNPGRLNLKCNFKNNVLETNNTLIGAFFINTQNAAIFNNSISGNTQIGVGLGGNQKVLFDCNGINVNKNIGHNAALSYQSNFGGSEVKCNSFQSYGYGQEVLGVSDQTGLKGNIFSHATTGLLLEGETFIGKQKYYGNQWTGTYESYPAVHTGTDFFIEGSSFIVDPASPSSYRPTYYTPNTVNIPWFVPVAPKGISTFQCQIPQDCGSYYQVPIEQESLFSDHPLIMYKNTTELSGLSSNTKEILSKHLVLSSRAINTDIANSIKNTSNTSMIDKYIDLVDFELNLQRDLISNQVLNTAINDLQSSLEQKVISIENMLKDNYIPSVDEPLFIQRITETRSFNMSYDTLQNQRILGAKALMSSAISQRSYFVTSTAIQMDENKLDRIFLEGTLSGATNSSDIPYINDISERCPSQYGDAVFKARALRLRYDEDYAYLLDNSCNNPIESRGQKTESGIERADWTLYPNPNNGNFTIQTVTNLVGNVQLTISNSLGIKMDIKYHWDNKSKISLSTENLADGLYFITIEYGQNDRQTLKFIKNTN
jgi:hypothetical protein